MKWYSGLNNYKIQTTTDNKFLLEYLEQPFDPNLSIQEIYVNHLNSISRPFVEILFSGGVDSEILLLTLLEMKIPVKVKTIKLYFNDLLINGYDLYFVDNFCRANNIKVDYINLEITKFHGSAKDIDICTKYHIQKPYQSFTFYALQQCEGYVIMGGEHPWVTWSNGKFSLICPSITFSSYELFFKDYGLEGIGNMQTYSLGSLYKFVKSHLQVFFLCEQKYYKNKYKYLEIGNIKRELLTNLGYKVLPRVKMNGFEPLIRYKQYHEEITIEFAKNFTQYYGELKLPNSIQMLLDEFSN